MIAAKGRAAPIASNHIEEVHAFWVAGGSCDGCSIAAVGATSPSVEDLLRGVLPCRQCRGRIYAALQISC